MKRTRRYPSKHSGAYSAKRRVKVAPPALRPFQAEESATIKAALEEIALRQDLVIVAICYPGADRKGMAGEVVITTGLCNNPAHNCEAHSIVSSIELLSIRAGQNFDHQDQIANQHA